MSEIKSNYTKVPDAIINAELPASHLRVMLRLLQWQNAPNHYESHETIAYHCGLDASTVKRALRALQKINYITIISRKKEQKTNIYKINFEQIDGFCVLSPEEKELRELRMVRERDAKREREIEDKINKQNIIINPPAKDKVYMS
jgi:hypothetical protein